MEDFKYLPVAKIKIAKTDNHEKLHPEESRKPSSEPRSSVLCSEFNSISDDHASSIVMDNEEEPIQQFKPIAKSIKKSKQVVCKSKSNISNKLLSSCVITDNESSVQKMNSTRKPFQSIPVIPTIDRRGVQGVLVRFFRNGDVFHPGVTLGINAVDIKSWEAFLNFLNQQSKLMLPNGAIQYIYTRNGQQIRSMNQLENHQSYVVASGAFTKTNYRHATESMNDGSNGSINKNNQIPSENKTLSGVMKRSSSNINGDQLYIFPYSCLNAYEVMILNRNSTVKFDKWINEQITDLLYHHIGDDAITHLFAITNYAFVEIQSFSHLFNILKSTDRFIACTDKEYQQSKRYLPTIVAEGFFNIDLSQKRIINDVQRSTLKQDAKLAIRWIYGYDGTNNQTKTLYNISENEILYVINAICILYHIDSKQQRFYTKHNNTITCLATHRCQPFVASSETISSKDRLYVLLHIWNHTKLETVSELRQEQFGSEISLLSFSSKSDDNFILIVSRDKPKIVLITDWKRNEILFSIVSKSDRILSTCFAFNTNSWISCISQQYLVFYLIDWKIKPIKIISKTESEVQDIYTGAVICAQSTEILIVGDKIGSLHIWCLNNNEAKLLAIRERILENAVQILVSVNDESCVLANVQNQMKLWHVRSNTVENMPTNETYGSIQSVCSIRRGLAIGTKSNYILLKEFNSENINVLMRGHRSPLTCITTNENLDDFFSISADRYLYKWNRRMKSIQWSIKSPQSISCANLHPQRNIIVLGTETSKLLIYDTLSSCYVTTIPLKMNSGVKSVRFSPNGRELAVGLKNGDICLFEVLGNGEFELRDNEIFQNNVLPIADIAWSMDSNYLLVIYSDENYQIWSMTSFDIVQENNIENISWNQITNPIACNLIGRIDKPISDMHTSTIVLEPNLVLCAGKDGQIRLYQSSNKRNIRTLQIGLGSIQSMIELARNDTYLLSINNNSAIVEIQVNIESS